MPQITLKNKPLNQQKTALKKLEQQNQDLAEMDLKVAERLLNTPGMSAEVIRMAEEFVRRQGKEIKLKASDKPPANSPDDRNAAFLELYKSAVEATSAEQWLKKLDSGHNSGPLTDLLSTILGIQGRSAVSQVFSELIGSIGVTDYRHAFLSTLEMMRSLAPEGATQTMLATQMLSVHNLAIRSIGRAARADSGSFEATELYTNQAMKLMRLFNQQAELLARLQGKITQQRIVVEKLDVQEGGRAVVGTIEQHGK